MFLRCPLPLFNSTFFSLAGGSDCKTFASVLQWCSKHNDEPKGCSLFVGGAENSRAKTGDVSVPRGMSHMCLDRTN